MKYQLCTEPETGTENWQNWCVLGVVVRATKSSWWPTTGGVLVGLVSWLGQKWKEQIFIEPWNCLSWKGLLGHLDRLPCSEHPKLDQVTRSLVPTDSEYLQGQSIHHLSGQPVPMLHYSYCKQLLPVPVHHYPYCKILLPHTQSIFLFF